MLLYMVQVLHAGQQASLVSGAFRKQHRCVASPGHASIKRPFQPAAWYSQRVFDRSTPFIAPISM